MALPDRISIVTGLMIQVIEKTFTSRLADYNLQVFLETYILIFANREMRVLIEEFNDALITKYQEYHSKIWDDVVMYYNSNVKNYPDGEA